MPTVADELAALRNRGLAQKEKGKLATKEGGLSTPQEMDQKIQDNKMALKRRDELKASGAAIDLTTQFLLERNKGGSSPLAAGATLSPSSSFTDAKKLDIAAFEADNTNRAGAAAVGTKTDAPSDIPVTPSTEKSTLDSDGASAVATKIDAPTATSFALDEKPLAPVPDTAAKTPAASASPGKKPDPFPGVDDIANDTPASPSTNTLASDTSGIMSDQDRTVAEKQLKTMDYGGDATRELSVSDPANKVDAATSDRNERPAITKDEAAATSTSTNPLTPVPVTANGDPKFVEEQVKTMDYNGGDAKRELSTQRNHVFDASSTSTNAKGAPVIQSKSFQPRGVIEFPLRLKDGAVKVDSSAVRTSISCNVPGEVWNAKFSGSSLVRGPMGAATGTVLMSYNVKKQTLQAVSQIAVGDQANVMCGGIYHTSAAWYGFGAYYYPKALQGTKYALQVQSEQKLEHGSLVLKFLVPAHTLQPNTTMAFTNQAAQFQLRVVKSQPHVDVSFSPRLSPYRKLKLCFQWRQAGTKVDAILNQTLSKGSALGVGVRHDSRQGLSWLFTWIRGDVTIKIPIFLMSHTEPLQHVCSLGLTFTSYLIQELLADLWKLEATTATKSLPRSIATKARADAEKQRLLMVRQANSRRATEEKKQGLVITKATYFCVGGDSLDVTTQLQFWTTKSSLDLPALSKQNLLGFYNVAAGVKVSSAEPEWWEFWKPKKRTSRLTSAAQVPKLWVKYDYSGESYEISIADQEALSLPSSKARRVAAAAS